MSDVSFISAAPARDFNLDRRTPEQPAGQKPAEPARAKEAAPASQLPSKTKVMTEFRKAFQVAYTFIDPDTDRVVGRWPVTPPAADDAPGGHFEQTV